MGGHWKAAMTNCAAYLNPVTPQQQRTLMPWLQFHVAARWSRLCASRAKATIVKNAPKNKLSKLMLIVGNGLCSLIDCYAVTTPTSLQSLLSSDGYVFRGRLRTSSARPSTCHVHYFRSSATRGQAPRLRHVQNVYNGWDQQYLSNNLQRLCRCFIRWITRGDLMILIDVEDKTEPWKQDDCGLHHPPKKSSSKIMPLLWKTTKKQPQFIHMPTQQPRVRGGRTSSSGYPNLDWAVFGSISELDICSV